MELVTALLSWYAANRRELPWRDTSDPYRVWLSEVILQQTRVSQGMAYYYRFLELFPTVDDLAGATEDQVLRAWQGLGYYSRARNLHATAREVSASHGGRFPDSWEGLIRLRGIGPYTAAAIASFCFGEARAVVDGNVIRFLGRLYGVDAPADSPAGRRIYQELAQSLIPAHDPGTWNQAVMEFGALRCTPRQPGCADCPFARSCVARLSGDATAFPLKSRRPVVKDVYLYYVFLREPGHTWVRRRGHSGIWKGLYDFPCIESDAPLMADEVAAAFDRQLGIAVERQEWAERKEFVHMLSHRRIHAVFMVARRNRMWKNNPAEYRRIPLADLGEYGVPRLVERFLGAL